MIKTTNKGLSLSPVIPDQSRSIYDANGKPLKLTNKYYGKAEANILPDEAYKYLPQTRKNFRQAMLTKSFEYDFAETNRIIDTEALVATIFRKKKALITKHKPTLQSKSDRNADYIQKRLSEMEHVSGVRFTELLGLVAESLVSYNNVFLLKHRNDFSSQGLSREGKSPLVALFILSPTRLEPIVDELHDLVGYKYYSKSRNHLPIYLEKSEVYHIYSDKKIDLSVGTPPLEAVKDDIQSLRQMEESVERLVYKNASPFLHAKIGNDEYPAGQLPNGQTEIDYYTGLIQTMEDEGGLTTSHRVDISLLGAESQALRIEPYIEYFKQRVLSGLRASMLDIGEAKSISTAGANFVSQVLRQDVEAYQDTIEKFFTECLFNDLLLESRWYKDKIRIPKEDEVELNLKEVDLETQIRVESHLANLVRYGLLDPVSFSSQTGHQLPPAPVIQADTAMTGDGSMANVAQPQNQHSKLDAEYEVLDSIVKTEDGKMLPKAYYYVEDALSGVLENKGLEDLSLDLTALIKNYKDQGLETRKISEAVYTFMEKVVLGSTL